MAQRQRREPLDARGFAGGQQPRDDGAVIVADDVGALDPQRVHDPPHVGDRVEDHVVVHAQEAVRVAEPAHIRCDDAKPRPDEGRHLMPPKVGRVGKSMQQHHRRAVALVHDVEREIVRLDALPRQRSLRHGGYRLRASIATVTYRSPIGTTRSKSKPAASIMSRSSCPVYAMPPSVFTIIATVNTAGNTGPLRSSSGVTSITSSRPPGATASAARARMVRARSGEKS